LRYRPAAGWLAVSEPANVPAMAGLKLLPIDARHAHAEHAPCPGWRSGSICSAFDGEALWVNTKVAAFAVPSSSR